MLQGHCSCGAVHYQIQRAPLFVHCCHCHWCQRESGSAFALNAMIEADAVEVTKGAPKVVDVPTQSGRGQRMFQCSDCGTLLWSQYLGLGTEISLVRVGTLDNPDACPPDIHIFTESKQAWVQIGQQIGQGVPVRERYYNRTKYWTEEALERFHAVMG